MKADNIAALRRSDSWYDAASCRLEDLQALAGRTSALADHPFAARIEAERVPVYDCNALRHAIAAGGDARHEIMAEWISVLRDGAGIVMLGAAFEDAAPVDRATDVFEQLIREQHERGEAAGDHFAKPGANDRIWNALEKLCLADADAFARYYANDMVALVSEAWLGPSYQITSQVNVVNPGGAAQTPHRDYHLGFQSQAVVSRYPTHVHRFSPMLTLQGAVAHCDMPLESGPTLYMPFTQLYGPGYLASGDAGIRAWFEADRVQLPLRKGDAVFFNPALLHAAGHNVSASIRRMANLLQVSSAYGRAMETVDRTRMSAHLFPVLRELAATGALAPGEVAHVVAATAEGYAFPTNLDRDPPIGGLAPKNGQDLLHEALAEGWEAARFEHALAAQAERRLS